MSRVNSPRKGIKGELEARNLWREFYLDCERTFGQSRYGGEEAPDIGCPEMNKHWYVEVKRYNKVYSAIVEKWIAKAIKEHRIYCTREGVAPQLVLMIREDNNDWHLKNITHSIGAGWLLWQQFKDQYLSKESEG